jgi:hypothetical protein
MKKIILGAALVPLLVGACAGVDQLGDRAGALRGHSIKDAIARYGYPTDQKQIAGDTAYIWKTDTGGYGMVPCTLRFITGPDDVIKAADVIGSDKACGYWATR